MSYKLVKNNNIECMKYCWIFGSILAFYLIFRNVVFAEPVKCGKITLKSNVEKFSQNGTDDNNDNNNDELLRSKKRVYI